MSRIISISAVAYDGHDLSVALPEIRRLGVEYVELAFIKGYSGTFDEGVFDPANARRIAGILSSAGLRNIALSAQMDLSMADAVPLFRHRLAFARDIGASIVITNAGSPSRRRQFDDNIAELAGIAQSLGLVIALENPGDGVESIVNDGRRGAAVIQAISSDAVRLNYDFGNVISHFRGAVRPEEDFQYALPYAAYLHIKDVSSGAQGWTFPAVGQGELDYDRILAILAAQPVVSPMSIEIPTRVSRAPDASPRIAPQPLALADIGAMLRSSLAYIQAKLSEQ